MEKMVTGEGAAELTAASGEITGTMGVINAIYPGRITLSVEELALLIHMTPVYIRKEIRAGRFLIPFIRIGNRVMFPVSAVVSALDDDATTPTTRRRGRPTKEEGPSAATPTARGRLTKAELMRREK